MSAASASRASVDHAPDAFSTPRALVRAHQEPIPVGGFVRWAQPTVASLGHLTQAERDLVELRLAVSRAVRARRKREGPTRAHGAECLKTSQSRFARIEAGARGVSLDPMFRSLYILGGPLKDVRTTARGRRQRPRLVPSDGGPLPLSKRTKPRGHRPPSQ